MVTSRVQNLFRPSFPLKPATPNEACALNSGKMKLRFAEVSKFMGTCVSTYERNSSRSSNGDKDEGEPAMARVARALRKVAAAMATRWHEQETPKVVATIVTR